MKRLISIFFHLINSIPAYQSFLIKFLAYFLNQFSSIIIFINILKYWYYVIINIDYYNSQFG